MAFRTCIRRSRCPWGMSIDLGGSDEDQDVGMQWLCVTGDAGRSPAEQGAVSQHGSGGAVHDGAGRGDRAGAERWTELRRKGCRRHGDGAAWLRDGGQGHEWFRVRGGTIVDRAEQRSKLLESEAAWSGLPECGSGANVSSADNQEDRAGPGGSDQGTDVRRDEDGVRQERVARAGTWGDVLHAVETGVPGRR